MGKSEWSNNDKEDDSSAKSEGKGEHSNWLDNKGEAWNIKGTAIAAITPIEEDTDPWTELYNSSASQHLSPYKADFSSYAPLSLPLYLNVANQIKFPVIGMGTLVV